MSPAGRKPYSATRKGLVLAIDFGTTFSGVSYAVLEPGFVPQVQSVSGYPGQEDMGSSTKVPTVLYYDKLGVLKACGAEVNDPEFSIQVAEGSLIVVEWFKLLLRPSQQAITHGIPKITLPPDHTVITVLADYLKYLQNAARNYLGITRIDGEALWNDVRDRIIYVLGHPNGWDGPQHSKMRAAAVLAGFIPDTEEGHARIRFVSEGEASFHWCVDVGLAVPSLNVGARIIVADAGGGTLDVTAFTVTATSPLRIAESHAPESRMAGSVFVTKAFETFVRDKLKDSPYGDEDSIGRALEHLDRKTKKIFHDNARSSFIPIAGNRDVDAEHNIRVGQLMVKGLSASKSFYTLYHSAKAVSDGAVAFFLDHYVCARLAKRTYGMKCYRDYDVTNIEHAKRSSGVCTDISGTIYLPNGWCTHVTKGTIVDETRIYRQGYHLDEPTPNTGAYKSILQAYTGDLDDIKWDDDDPDAFVKVCTVRANIPTSAGRRKVNPSGTAYWRFDYEIVIMFGMIELECYVEWTDEGQVKRGPVTVVWNER